MSYVPTPVTSLSSRDLAIECSGKYVSTIQGQLLGHWLITFDSKDKHCYIANHINSL